MSKNDQYYDKLLNIETMGKQQGFNKSFHYHRYEATSYDALDQLFKVYQLNRKDRVVDFGCGKGRLNFYVHYYHQASAIGIEMNDILYNEALENQRTYVKSGKKLGDKLQFECCLAEEYKVDARDNVFYFFNPFSKEIFMRVIQNILQSVEEKNRKVDVILYYPSEDYLYYLENRTPFEWKEEVRLADYERDARDRFVVFSMEY